MHDNTEKTCFFSADMLQYNHMPLHFTATDNYWNVMLDVQWRQWRWCHTVYCSSSLVLNGNTQMLLYYMAMVLIHKKHTREKEKKKKSGYHHTL